MSASARSRRTPTASRPPNSCCSATCARHCPRRARGSAAGWRWPISMPAPATPRRTKRSAPRLRAADRAAAARRRRAGQRAGDGRARACSRWRCPTACRRAAITFIGGSAPSDRSTMTGTWSEVFSQLRLSRNTRAPSSSADQRRRHPDMVEPAAAVRGRPVASCDSSTRCRAAPVGGTKWRTASTNPPACLQRAEPLDLDRGVADDAQELLVRPHIGFERRDVEVADRDHLAAVAALVRANHAVSSSRKRSLWANFGLASGSGDVAAGRDVDVVQLDAAGQLGDRVPAIAALAPGARRRRSGTAPREGSRRRYSPSSRAHAMCW